MFADTVSVGGVDTYLVKHYGSAYAMTDYTSKNHNVFASFAYLPVSALTVTGTVNYNKATGSLDKVIMQSVEDKLSGALSHQDFTFDEMDTYSNLDYALINFTLGMEYRVSPTVVVTADMDYADLDDKAGYVYGIESGSYFMIRSGVRLDF